MLLLSVECFVRLFECLTLTHWWSAALCLLRFAASVASGLYYLWMVSLFFGEIRGISEMFSCFDKGFSKGWTVICIFWRAGQQIRRLFCFLRLFFFHFIDKFGRRFHLSIWCESSKDLSIAVSDSNSTWILFEFKCRQDLEVQQQQHRVVSLVVAELVESCKEWNQVSSKSRNWILYIVASNWRSQILQESELCKKFATCRITPETAFQSCHLLVLCVNSPRTLQLIAVPEMMICRIVIVQRHSWPFK